MFRQKIQHLLFENLEQRRLMSAVTTIENAFTPILATGTQGNDLIDIGFQNVDGHQQYNVRVNDSEVEYFDCTIPAIVINGRGGNDTIYVDGTAGVPTTISGGDGNDAIFINDFASQTLNPGFSHYEINGNAGKNTLTLRAGTASLADVVYDIDASNVRSKHVFGTGPDDFVDRTSAAYKNFSQLVFDGNDTDSDTHIHSTGAATPVMLKWGSGISDFTVGDGQLDSNIKSLVSIDAGAGKDSIEIDDHADSGNDGYQILPSEVNKGAGKPRIAYFNSEFLSLSANAHNNTINIDGTIKSCDTAVFGNGGDDVFNVGNRHLNKNVRGGLFIIGGAGSNKAGFGVQDEAPANFTVTPSTVQSDSTKTLLYAQIQTLSLYGNPGVNKFDVQPSANTEIHLLAGGPFSPSTPADQLSLNLSGVTGGKLKTTFSDSGIYSFDNRKPVVFSSIESFPAIGGNPVPNSGASISGAVFNDLDGDGVKDANEVGLAGRTVWIDLDNDKVLDANEQSAITDASGNYSFTGLAAGTYKVRQQLPGGWKQTTPSNGYGIGVTVAANQSAGGKLFGEKKI